MGYGAMLLEGGLAVMMGAWGLPEGREEGLLERLRELNIRLEALREKLVEVSE